MRFDLAAGFPLVTTKKVHLRSVVYELLWFLRGETNVAWLREHGVTIWDEWADAQGELGPVYGKQWRDWLAADGRHIDQIAQAVEQLRRNPDSRRIIVSAWNVGELERMALMPCHALFQFYVAERPPVLPALPAQLRTCSSACRSTSPATRCCTHMFAQQCDLEPGEFVWTGGDCHLYLNHLEQADLQLARAPLPLPQLAIRRRPASIFEYDYEDFEFVNYQHHRGDQGAGGGMSAVRRHDCTDAAHPVRDSPLHGRGVFAHAASRRATRVIEYLGERVIHAEADRRYARRTSNDNHTFLFIVDSQDRHRCGRRRQRGALLQSFLRAELRVGDREAPRLHRGAYAPSSPARS